MTSSSCQRLKAPADSPNDDSPLLMKMMVMMLGVKGLTLYQVEESQYSVNMMDVMSSICFWAHGFQLNWSSASFSPINHTAAV